MNAETEPSPLNSFSFYHIVYDKQYIIYIVSSCSKNITLKLAKTLKFENRVKALSNVVIALDSLGNYQYYRQKIQEHNQSYDHHR